MIEYTKWPKIPRLNRDMVVTEKLDGNNVAVIIDTNLSVGAQSRTRLINPFDDLDGFANWVWEWADLLAVYLGPGVHFGEWWGGGIKRGYGLEKTDKRFSLFNTKRWMESLLDGYFEDVPGLGVVPVLYGGPFSSRTVNWYVNQLRERGSSAVPGYMRPEGVVAFHTAANTLFKVTLEKDDAPKGGNA